MTTIREGITRPIVPGIWSRATATNTINTTTPSEEAEACPLQILLDTGIAASQGPSTVPLDPNAHGAVQLAIEFDSGATGTVTVQGRSKSTDPWHTFLDIEDDNYFAEIVRLPFIRASVASLAGGRVKVAIRCI